MDRLPNLDPLRFFLASLVILFHLPQLSYNQGLPSMPIVPILNRGTEAVYMFFVLSGFLIIRLIYRHKLDDRFSIRKFYMRRVLRILPLYYLIVVFGFIFYNVILPYLGIPFEIKYELSEGILLTVFFLPNVFAKLYAPGGILEVLWSIGIEEQFYLMIAPLLFILSKNWILRVLSSLLILYFVLFHLDAFSWLREFWFVYFFLFFGGIVAILEEKQLLGFLKKTFVIPILIVVATLLYFFTDLFQFEQVWLYNLFTMLLFGMFIHTLAHNNRKKEVHFRLLNHLGHISYGIYMYHVIAMNAVVFIGLKLQGMNIFSDSMLILLIYILTFVLTISLAHISYKYFETYFLKLKNKFR
ncbi:MAG TPA: acyltransferase [Aquaticitalea sp.]|nr:acyltransferase [Aquaticitalea sp.]